MSIDIETSRAICDVATPGPWRQSKYGITEHIHIEYGPHAIATAARKEDRAFVVHARTALPAALDEIERLDRDLDEVMAERDKAQDALSSAHAALGGDGEWACRTYDTEPGHSGDLHKDVPVLAAALRAEIERLRAFRASLGAWMESYEDEAQSFLASSGLSPHVHAFHRGRVKAMEDLLSFLEDSGGEG